MKKQIVLPSLKLIKQKDTAEDQTTLLNELIQSKSLLIQNVKLRLDNKFEKNFLNFIIINLDNCS